MAYNPNIPLPGDLLSNSQAQLLNNFASANVGMGKNHFPFSDLTTSNGKHKFVEMPVSATLPVGLATGEGTLYTKTQPAVTGPAEMFYSPDLSGQEYQMTTTSVANFGTFATNTVYNGATPKVSGGWTFLPGGMLLQYGFITTPTTNDLIIFPIAFQSFGMVTLGSVRGLSSNPIPTILAGSITLLQFRITTAIPVAGDILYWQAVGK